MNIIGISAFFHDSSAVLINKEEIKFAIQEERLTRIKHDSNFPKESIKLIKKKYDLEINDIQYFVFYDKPIKKFVRLIDTYLSYAPKGFKSFAKSIPLWGKEKLYQSNIICENLASIFNVSKKEIKAKLLFSEHHLSHAASAFFPSPFKESAILTLDGVGEYATSSISVGNKNKIETLKEINFPNSLGLFYSAFTYFTGFKVNSGEYKLMGLAPYGNPVFKKKIYDNLIHVFEDGSFILNQKYFDYTTGLKMTSEKMEELFGTKARNEKEEILPIHMDIAASIQAVLEEVILKICLCVKKITNLNNLCLAGGVALNCVANSKIIKNNIFEKIWIQPASSDSGGALGAAQFAYYHLLNNDRNVKNEDNMKGSYLGNDYSNSEIENQLNYFKLKFKNYDNNDLTNYIANNLAKGKIIGWFQGRSEYGPRSLGSRSILADPRPTNMQSKLNLKIKFRESFRPFAPSIIEDNYEECFDTKFKNEYMLTTSFVKNSNLKNKKLGFDQLNEVESEYKSITHVDLSARAQIIYKNKNPKFYDLIKAFYTKTGCPMVINTSFNVRGEPIVESPEDAIKCFLGTDLDTLAIGNLIIEKKEQNLYLLTTNYFNNFTKD